VFPPPDGFGGAGDRSGDRGSQPAGGPSGVDDLVDIERDGSLVLRVHVQPGSTRPGVAGRHGAALKVRVGAPPADGRANRALVDVLARALDVPRRRIELVSGASARAKRVRIRGLDVAELARRLDLPDAR
jgi:hypothetical protein